MASPFPGMNPYLEDPDIWPDFHGSFLMELRSKLNQSLPQMYVARWDRYASVNGAKGRPFTRIVDARGKRVVTVIEMLSPANKSRGVDHEAYLVVRQEYLQTGTNLVEIDLLRGGQRAPVEGGHAPCDYCILVSRAVEFPRAGIWRLTIRDPLPRIPIPLNPGVEDVWIALQKCFEPVCERGRNEEDVDYTQSPPVPATSEENAAWVREQLISRRK